jgi:hypothetical protein
VETLLVKNCVNPVQVELTDFVGNPEAARGNINAWVEKLTKGHIKDLGRGRMGPPCTLIFALVGFSSYKKNHKLLPVFLAVNQGPEALSSFVFLQAFCTLAKY